MLDKVIIDHLNEMDILEANIEDDLDSMLAEIDIDELIDNPALIMNELGDDMQSLLEEKYYHQAAEKGIKFAKNIVDDGDIKIDRSKNPNKNEDIL